MGYVPFETLPSAKTNAMNALVHEVLREDSSKWWSELSGVIRHNKLSLRHTYNRDRGLLATHISCFQDMILVRLAKKMGLPRGFVLIMDVEAKQMVGAGTFYPKFANDSRQRNIDDIYDDSVDRLSFYIKYSGSLGITTIFKHNNEVCYTVSSKNSCDTTATPPRRSFPTMGHEVVSPHLTEETLEKLWSHGITTIGSENFYADDASHGYAYHKSGFIVTSMSRLFSADGEKKISYLEPSELFEICSACGLPADEPCTLKDHEKILKFLDVIAQNRNILTLTLLEKGVTDLNDPDVHLRNNHRRLIKGDIIEGFVIRRWAKGVELPSIKYKCWTYQMVTQCLRPFLTHEKNALDYRNDLQPIRKINKDGGTEVDPRLFKVLEKALKQWCVFTEKRSIEDPNIALQKTICRWFILRAAAISKASATPLKWKDTYVEAYWATLGRQVVDEFVTAMNTVGWDLKQFAPTEPTLEEVDTAVGARSAVTTPKYKPQQMAVLIPVGVPCMGKSTVMRTLCSVFRQSCHYDTQDNHANFTSFINCHLQKVAAYMKGKGTKYILVADRNNHTESHREAVLNAFAQRPKGLKKRDEDDMTDIEKIKNRIPFPIFVNFAGVWDAEGTVCDVDRDAEEVYAIAESRLNQRGCGHKSVQDPHTGRRVIRSFIEEFEPPVHHTVINPPIRFSVEEKTLYIIEELTKLNILPPIVEGEEEEEEDEVQEDQEELPDCHIDAFHIPTLKELSTVYAAVKQGELALAAKVSPLIDSITFDEETNDTIIALCKAHGVKPSKEEFHVTIGFYPENSVEHAAEIAKHIGKPYECVITNFVKDDKGACIEVSLGKKSARSEAPIPLVETKRYHITVWNAPGVRPVYSNDLLAKKESSEVSVTPISGDVVVSGVITRRHNKTSKTGEKNQKKDKKDKKRKGVAAEEDGDDLGTLVESQKTKRKNEKKERRKAQRATGDDKGEEGEEGAAAEVEALMVTTGKGKKGKRSARSGPDSDDEE